MKPTFRLVRYLVLAALVALAAIALAQGMRGPGNGSGMPMHGAPQAGGAAGVPGPMGAMMGTHVVDEASFLVHMIPHHEEAVAAAGRLRAVTERPELLALADAIVTTQTAEIEAMSGWLDQWHPDADRADVYEPMMRVLRDDATAADVERAFLEDMIVHHMMAVHDAQTLLAGGHAEHEEVATLARSIVATQHAEMLQMRTWLASWFGGAAPMGMGGMGLGPMANEGFGFGPMGMGASGFGRMGMGMMGFGPTGMGPDGWMAHHGFGTAFPDEPGRGLRSGAALGEAQAVRLALAFLAGRGEAATAADVVGATVAYEVVVRVGDEERVLQVDVRTGEVSLLSDR